MGILERDKAIMFDSKINWGRMRCLKIAVAILVLFVPFLTSSCAEVSETAMPNLVGLSLDEAKDVLDGIGMKVDLNYLDVKSDPFKSSNSNTSFAKKPG